MEAAHHTENGDETMTPEMTGLTRDAAEAVAWKLVAEKLARELEEAQADAEWAHGMAADLKIDLDETRAVEEQLRLALAECWYGFGGQMSTGLRSQVQRALGAPDMYDPDPDWRTD